MASEIDLDTINKKIRLMQKTAEELLVAGAAIPAVEKNTDRILAGLKMMEINICDCVDL